MKRIMILALGFCMALGTSAEARHDSYRDRDHDGDRVAIRLGSSRYDGDSRYYSRPPRHVHRRWHRDRVHTWNGHRYHWHNGGWVVYVPGRTVVYR